MEVLFNYGNPIFWIGLLLAAFLAACEFYLNDMNVPLARYQRFTFAKHPDMQKICRALYVVNVLLALFAEVGDYWRNQAFSCLNYFINLMVVLLIYFVVCYSLVICLLWALSALWKMIRLFIAALIYIAKDTVEWINAE